MSLRDHVAYYPLQQLIDVLVCAFREKYFNSFFYCMCMSVLPTCMSAAYAYVEAKRGYQIPRNWFEIVGATTWVVEIKFRSSTGTARTLNDRAISSTSEKRIFSFYKCFRWEENLQTHQRRFIHTEPHKSKKIAAVKQTTQKQAASPLHPYRIPNMLIQTGSCYSGK